jgi:hypothetical protein
VLVHLPLDGTREARAHCAHVRASSVYYPHLQPAVVFQIIGYFFVKNPHYNPYPCDFPISIFSM